MKSARKGDFYLIRHEETVAVVCTLQWVWSFSRSAFLRNRVCAFHASENGLQAFTARDVLRLNCPAASTTVPAMKKSIILVSAVAVVVMALVSCASNSDVRPSFTSSH